MRNLLFLTLLITLPLCGNAQAKPKITAYFDKYWIKVKDPSQASFYRTVEKVNGKFMARDYYMSGQLQMEVLCDDVNPKLKWNGPAVLYHENGTKQEEGPFKDEERYGFHRYWYDNGAPRKEVFHKDKTTQVYRQYWTRDGVALLKDGDGFFQEQTGEVLTYTEVKDSLVFSTFQIDPVSGDSIYGQIEKQAEYKGGLDALRNDLKATLKYPKEARKVKVEGMVYVSFVVSKDGSVRNVKVIRGIGAGCDEEAARAVSTLKQWNPGMHHGRPESSMFVLPVKFNLKGWFF